MHGSFTNSISSPRSDVSSAFSSPIHFKRTKLVNSINDTKIRERAEISNDRKDDEKYKQRRTNSMGISSKELEEIYQNSSRCGEIDRSLKLRKWRMASFRATIQVADLIFTHWETKSVSTEHSFRQRKQHFANYVVGFVMRVGPSVATLLHGLLYCLKLRHIYPQARGEQGCAHRLFVVSLFVASRYLNDRQLLIKPSHSTWSGLSGVFTASELERMETEFVTFIRGSLFIGISEMERCVEDFFLTGPSDSTVDFGNVVPGSIDWLEMISVSVSNSKSSSSSFSKDEDSIVPN